MTSQERDKITKRMLWIIPAMIPCIIGDYCMGLEPKDSTAVSFMISTGWLTIADWRIALSHIGGLIGTALYMVAALAFVRYLNEKLAQCGDKWSRRFFRRCRWSPGWRPCTWYKALWCWQWRMCYSR